jgi:hypothetical protein
MDQPKQSVVGKGLQAATSMGTSAFKNSRFVNKFRSKDEKERDVKNLLIELIKQFIVKQRYINNKNLTRFQSEGEENDIVLDDKLELSVKKIENGVESYDSDDIDSFLEIPLSSKEDPLTMKDLADTKAFATKGTCRLENEIDRIVNGKVVSMAKNIYSGCSLPDGNPLKITADASGNYITVSEYFENLNSRFGRKSTKSSSSESILNSFIKKMETKPPSTRIKNIIHVVNKVLEHKKYIPLTLMSISQNFYYEDDIDYLIKDKRAWNACLELVFGKLAAKVLSKKTLTIIDVQNSAITGKENTLDFGFKSIIPRIVKENNQLFTDVTGSVPGIDKEDFQTAINLVAYQSQTHYKSLLEQSFTTVNPVSTGPDTTSVPKVTNYNYPHDYYVGKANDTLQPYTSDKMFYAGHAAGTFGGDGDKESIVFFIPEHSDPEKKVCFNSGYKAFAANASTSTELVYRSNFGVGQAGGKRLTKKGGKKGGKKARKTAKKAKKSKKR